MAADNKLDAARRTVEALAPKSRSAINIKQAAQVGMVQFSQSKREKLIAIALRAGADAEFIDKLIYRAWLARLRLRFAGELPKPSDAKSALADFIDACRRMRAAAREFAAATRALGPLRRKMARRPFAAEDLVNELADLSTLIEDMEKQADAYVDAMAGRQAERPLDYVVVDALADAWRDAGLIVKFTGRGSTYFQRFASETVKPRRIDLSIYRAVFEARAADELPRRVRRKEKK